MKTAFRFLSFLLIGTIIFGGIIPVNASPGVPLVAQESDAEPAVPTGELPAVELGIAPDVGPQEGPDFGDAAAELDGYSAADVLAEEPPVLVAPVTDAAAVMAEVPAEEYGIDLATAPQTESLFLHALYLPAVSSAEQTEQQEADAGAAMLSAPAGTIYAYSARTADGANVTKTRFDVGNTIRYFGVLYNSTGATRSTFLTWNLSGPCGSSTLWSGWLNAIRGYNQWYIQGIAPNCPGAYTFSFRVTYAGRTTSRSSAFTVNSLGNVTMSSVATQDNTGTATSSFAAGAFIRYVAYLNNTTGAPRRVSLVYSLTGPCGAFTLWSGQVNTASGIEGWGLDRTVPKCVGNYTYTARVTYNGYTTSRSIPFSVTQAGTVAVTEVHTADRANNTRTTFSSHDPMRYIGTLSNSTGATRSTYTVWSIAGPGCTGTLWAGWLNVAPGARAWFLDGVAPNCVGDYTFTLAATYNGRTTTRSSDFTVVGGSIPPIPPNFIVVEP